MEFYKCPVCNGQGILNKPTYVAGDQQTWVSDKTQHLCHYCKGKKVVSGDNIWIESLNMEAVIVRDQQERLSNMFVNNNKPYLEKWEAV